MSRLVLGVIGHVDHGKTALVRALTGMETDRLPEERRRGISIALGFAHCRMGETDIDLIDMPGHERFVRTMVAGAAGIDAVLLVVAANEGIKPQTVEHVDIAGLLGIGRAIIAVTKTDLVGPAQAMEAGTLAARLAAAAGMTVGAPILTSAVAGEGIEALRQAIAAAAVSQAADDGFPYLPIDRCFSMSGHGTVITGTLRRGALSITDELEVIPSGLRVRLRGLQVHGRRVTTVRPGQRVAVNLRGMERAQAPVGAALCAPGLLRASAWLSVEVTCVASTLATGARLRLLIGTFEGDARLRLLDRNELTPGETAIAQLQCASPVAAPARERFILRLASPSATVAGGRVLDPDTVRQRRHAAGPLARLAALANLAPAGIVLREVEAAGAAGASVQALGRLAGLAPLRVIGVLQGQPIVVTQGVAVTKAARLIEVPRPAQQRQLLATETAMAGRLVETIRAAGLMPPDLTGDLQAKRLLDRLVREGALIRAPDRVQKRDLLFHRDALDAARRILSPLLADGPGLLVREAGEALGISRKYSVPLLEYFDAIRFTRRVGDRRVLVHRLASGPPPRPSSAPQPKPKGEGAESSLLPLPLGEGRGEGL